MNNEIKYVSPFKRFCITVGNLPTAYLESMSYYEGLTYLVNYLSNNVIPALNNNSAVVEELQEQFTILKNFVDNYFDNLDVQEEVNNKLDEMAEDGTLEEIIKNYLQTQKIYNTTEEMITDANNLVNGLNVQTLGYHTLNDDGGAFFQITDTISANDYQINLNNGLYATMIINSSTINVKQFGAYGDKNHDDTQAFKNAITYINDKYMNLYINKGEYTINETLYIDWENSNFWQEFNGSYSIKGAGIYETLLYFNSSNGLHINRNGNILSIEISDFSIVNESYNAREEMGITTLPNDNKGIGLLLKHIGYTGHVSRIGVRGFYIGIATRNCYGGPILDNLFTINTVFGYSSKNDTTVEQNSCSYMGLESCYIEENSSMTLTNIICEGNLDIFKTNEFNQREKFHGRGFSIYDGARINLMSCYSEKLFGNARYIEHSNVVEDNGVLNNNMIYYLEQPGYEDLKTWVTNNNWNYDEVYINITNNSRTYCMFNSPDIENRTAYINDENPRGNADMYNGKYLAPNIIFNGVTPHQGAENTFRTFSNGNCQPIIYLKGTYEYIQQNYSKLPAMLYGLIKTRNIQNAGNWNGDPSLIMSRKGNFTNTSYDEVALMCRHTLDGAIRLYRVTYLSGTQVESKEVITIANDGKVTFPQN